jgi:hypothetical protein
MAIDDPSVIAVQNLASLVGVIMIAAVAYGGLVRRPTPPAYQILLTGLTLSVVLRILQAYFEAQGVILADAISQANVILVSMATIGAVVSVVPGDRAGQGHASTLMVDPAGVRPARCEPHAGVGGHHRPG